MTKKIGNTESLREMLFSELEGLKSGKINVSRATVTYKIAAQILNAARLDLEHYKIIKSLEAEHKSTPITSVTLIGA